jgi:integrase/recombinase XerD
MESGREVKIYAVNHHQERRILIQFSQDEQLNQIVRQLPEIQWSLTLKGWHIANNPKNLRLIFRTFKGFASIDKSGVFGAGSLTLNPGGNEDSTRKLSPSKLPVLSEKTSHKVDEFILWMKHRRYSENTIKTYSDGIRTFLKFHSIKALETISNKDLVDFNNQYILKKGYSSSYQNQVVNAVKLFFLKVENRELDIEQIERPRREFRLPNVLSKEEVKAILEAPVNLKHRAMLSLIYACGLRRSELLDLRQTDVDSKRGLLIIRQSKGNKDRLVPLSIKIIELLRDYYKAYRPNEWLFEGQQKGDQYSAVSLQQVLRQSLVKAKIKKPVTLHWLRHSYATHLLESGTDLRYIQELLGHKSSRTTEIYTHVSQKSIQQIKSPFDDL